MSVENVELNARIDEIKWLSGVVLHGMCIWKVKDAHGAPSQGKQVATRHIDKWFEQWFREKVAEKNGTAAAP